MIVLLVVVVVLVVLVVVAIAEVQWKYYDWSFLVVAAEKTPVLLVQWKEMVIIVVDYSTSYCIYIL